MITVVAEGDIFASHAQTWVNTVNTVGVMGKGIALGFKRRFPEMYEDYVVRCKRGEVQLGRPYLWRATDPWVVNFPTKQHWRSVSKLADIIQGLEFLASKVEEWGVTSLAVPPLGCGEGGLEWRVVGPALYARLARLSIPVELYAPFGTPHAELQPSHLEQLSFEAPQLAMGPPSKVPLAWIALCAVLARLEEEPFHYPVGRIGWQKLAYFAGEAGLPTNLRFERGSYGPYAAGMKKLTSALVNNGLLEERATEGRMIRVQVGPTFEAFAAAYADELDEWRPVVARVADLMARVDTRGAEVVATVLFSANEFLEANGRRPTEAEVIVEVRAWKQRRKPGITDDELAAAIRQLALLGWLKLEPTGSLIDLEDDLALA
jgi:O-acetyl-ADP-ribose deacetylase (regulator of RNase III)/uncharacterized protein YwgA